MTIGVQNERAGGFRGEKRLAGRVFAAEGHGEGRPGERPSRAGTRQIVEKIDGGAQIAKSFDANRALSRRKRRSRRSGHSISAIQTLDFLDQRYRPLMVPQLDGSIGRPGGIKLTSQNSCASQIPSLNELPGQVGLTAVPKPNEWFGRLTG